MCKVVSRRGSSGLHCGVQVCYTWGMSEIMSNPNTNVQVEGDIQMVGWLGVKDRIFVSLEINKILVDPDNPNIRGRIIDTTDIQDSIREVGVREPIQVRELPDRPGYFYLISGGRRLTAARRAGFSHIPAIIDENLETQSIRRMMLAAHVRKDHPPIVLDDTGMVVGGDCWAVYHEVESGTERKDVALLMGVTPDVAGAYYQLFSDVNEVKEKVSAGDMAITVYSLIKHQPVDVKLFIADKRGKVSANWVRKTLRNWEAIRETQRNLEENNAQGLAKSTTEEIVEYVDVHKNDNEEPASHYISEAAVSLSKLTDIRLRATDLYMLERVENTARILRERNDIGMPKPR